MSDEIRSVIKKMVTDMGFTEHKVDDLSENDLQKINSVLLKVLPTPKSLPADVSAGYQQALTTARLHIDELFARAGFYCARLNDLEDHDVMELGRLIQLLSLKSLPHLSVIKESEESCQMQ